MTGYLSTFTTHTRPHLPLGGFRVTSNPLAESTLSRFELAEKAPPITLLCTSWKTDSKYLHQLVESLIQQDQKLFELLVITRRDEDYRTWCDALIDSGINHEIKQNGELKGRVDAFKFGVNHSRTEWIYILDDDDYLNQNAVAVAHWTMERAGNFSVFCSDHIEINCFNQQKAVNKYDPHYQRLDVLSVKFYQRHFWGFTKRLVEDFPVLLESPYLCEDYWFFSRLALKSLPVFHIPHCLYFYRDNPYGMRRVQTNTMLAMCKAIQNELKGAMKKMPLGQLLGDCIMAERVIRTRKQLFGS